MGDTEDIKNEATKTGGDIIGRLRAAIRPDTPCSVVKECVRQALDCDDQELLLEVLRACADDNSTANIFAYEGTRFSRCPSSWSEAVKDVFTVLYCSRYKDAIIAEAEERFKDCSELYKSRQLKDPRGLFNVIRWCGPTREAFQIIVNAVEKVIAEEGADSSPADPEPVDEEPGTEAVAADRRERLMAIMSSSPISCDFAAAEEIFMQIIDSGDKQELCDALLACFDNDGGAGCLSCFDTSLATNVWARLFPDYKEQITLAWQGYLKNDRKDPDSEDDERLKTAEGFLARIRKEYWDVSVFAVLAGAVYSTIVTGDGLVPMAEA